MPEVRVAEYPVCDVPYEVCEAPERFMSKVVCDMQTGCWNWTAALYSNGYGHYTDGGKYHRRDLLAHRWLWEEVFFFPLPREIDLDHLCRNRACVRPEHLLPATRSQNLKRGVGVGGDRTSALWRTRWKSE